MEQFSGLCAERRSVVVLCSGFGLGFYIPGLLIRDTLRSIGIDARAEVFESLIVEPKLDLVERNRQAYHVDFRVALASQRIPSDVRGSLNPTAVSSVLERWQAEDRRNFICLSGHWVHILELYRRRRPDISLHVDLLHLDAEDSPSWKQLRKIEPDYADAYHVANLYDSQNDRIFCRVDTNTGAPLPFESRNSRLVVHGGGWGMGTYRDTIPALEAADFQLDVVGYGRSDINHGPPTRRYYIENLLWRTWHLDTDGDCQYPPSAVFLSGADEVPVTAGASRHNFHEVVRYATAIVSKPGAGTLIDSLGTATPLILLEPFGAHEEANARVWLAAGFGVTYQDWAAAGYPKSMLEEIHLNLLKGREQLSDYSQTYAEGLWRR